MLFSCVPPRKTPDPESERGREAGGEPVAVDDGDVRRAGRRPGAERPVGVGDGARLGLERRIARRARRGARGSALTTAAALRRRRADLAAEDAELERLGLEDAVGPQVVRELGKQLDEHRRAGVADALERGARVGRPNARRIAVDATSSLVALEDPLEDRRAGTARCSSRSKPSRASAIAGSTSAAHSRVAKRSWTCSRPASSPGTATDPSPTWNTCVPESPKSIRSSSISPRLASGTPKKQSSIVVDAARLVHERESAAGRSRQRPLGHERGERRGEERVDGVAALAQDARAGLGRQRMTGCDRAAHPVRLLRSREAERQRPRSGRLQGCSRDPYLQSQIRVLRATAAARRQPAFRNEGSSGSDERPASRRPARTPARADGASSRRGRSRPPSPRPGR